MARYWNGATNQWQPTPWSPLSNAEGQFRSMALKGDLFTGKAKAPTSDIVQSNTGSFSYSPIQWPDIYALNKYNQLPKNLDEWYPKVSTDVKKLNTVFSSFTAVPPKPSSSTAPTVAQLPAAPTTLPKTEASKPTFLTQEMNAADKRRRSKGFGTFLNSII